jgi:hypothetical protein
VSEPVIETPLRSRDTDQHRWHQPHEVSDLSLEQRRGRVVATLMLDDLPLAALGHAAALALVCRDASGVELVRTPGALTVYKRLTDGQLYEALERARAEWDRAADLYDAVVAAGSWTGRSWADRVLVENYAQNAGLPPAVDA